MAGGLLAGMNEPLRHQSREHMVKAIPLSKDYTDKNMSWPFFFIVLSP
jgi:hypothetical protein